MNLLAATLSLVFTLLGAKHWPFIVITLIYNIFVFRRFNKATWRLSLIFVSVGIGLILLTFLASLYRPLKHYALVINTSKNYVLVRSLTGTIHVEIKNHHLAIGDVLLLEGKLSPLVNDYTDSIFSFKKYLITNGAKYSLYDPKVTYLVKSLWRPTHAINTFLAKWPSEAEPLLASLLFNIHDYDAPVIASSASLGVMFLFSVSGVYLNSVIALFDKIFALKFEKNKARIFSLIVLLPLWLFNLGKFSFYRIYITNIVRLIALKRKKEVSQLNLISAVMIGFLLIEPTLVINSSFYLGFGISLLLTFLRPTINRYSKFKRKFIPAFVIYFLLLPINLNSSYRLSLFGPLIQIIVRPIGTIIFILGYLSFLLNIVIRPIMPLIRLLLRLITLLAKLEFALEIAPFSAPILYVYYGLYLLFFIALEIGVHPLKNTSALIMTSLLLLQLVPLTNQISKAVYFINVGQGDSIVFRDHNVAVMIDTGGSRYIDIAEEVLLPFLTKHHIRYLDAVITTHDDFDHNGALPGLLAHNKVKKTLTNEEEFPYTVGNLTFTNLNRNVALDADDNDKSLVLYVEFIGEQWLLMGDASVAVEHKIINSFPSLRCSILKVGHHGSSTSTSAEFLNHVKPRVAIISVGKNYYGHPTVSVITLLEERKIKIRRTDEESTITYSRFAL